MGLFSLKDVITFNWVELYTIERENEFGIEAYNRLIKTLEDTLLSTMKKFQKDVEMDEDLKEMQIEGSGGSYYAAFYEWEERSLNELQKQQRYGLCLSLFSFLEGRLKTICTKLEGAFNNKIKADDLKGEDLTKYLQYLRKVMDIDISGLEKYYTPVNNQKKVRNLIAHQDGLGRKDQKGQINLVPGLAMEDLDDAFQINITDKVYLETLLKNMEHFLQKLLPLIDKKFETTKAS